MELKDFIEQTIVDVVGALENAGEATGRDIVLRPYGRYERGKFDIEFDVALTVTESIETTKGAEGGGKISSKISVLTMNLGEGNLEGKGKYNREQSTSQSTVSRVKFGVHVFSDADKEAAKKRQWKPRNFKQRRVYGD